MKDYVQFIAYWRSLELIEWLANILIIVLTLVTLINLAIFHSFVKSKAAGRKTVLGNIQHIFNI